MGDWRRTSTPITSRLHQSRHYSIAPDGFIPNSVIRALLRKRDDLSANDEHSEPIITWQYPQRSRSEVMRRTVTSSTTNDDDEYDDEADDRHVTFLDRDDDVQSTVSDNSMLSANHSSVSTDSETKGEMTSTTAPIYDTLHTQKKSQRKVVKNALGSEDRHVVASNVVNIGYLETDGDDKQKDDKLRRKLRVDRQHSVSSQSDGDQTADQISGSMFPSIVSDGKSGNSNVGGNTSTESVPGKRGIQRRQLATAPSSTISAQPSTVTSLSINSISSTSSTQPTTTSGICTTSGSSAALAAVDNGKLADIDVTLQAGSTSMTERLQPTVVAWNENDFKKTDQKCRRPNATLPDDSHQLQELGVPLSLMHNSKTMQPFKTEIEKLSANDRQALKDDDDNVAWNKSTDVSHLSVTVKTLTSMTNMTSDSSRHRQRQRQRQRQRHVIYIESPSDLRRRSSASGRLLPCYVDMYRMYANRNNLLPPHNQPRRQQPQHRHLSTSSVTSSVNLITV